MSGSGTDPSAEPDASSNDQASDASKLAAKDAGAVPALVRESSRTLQSYLPLFDFSQTPSSRAGWLVRLFAIGVGVVLLYPRVGAATRPLLLAKPPPPIPVEEIEDYRFRLPERERREIFAELAAAELAERARAIQANSWNGQLWSREDDRGHYERVAVRAAAAKHRVSLSQVYLVLDEGIRERWPAPNGEPLPGTTPPLNMRMNSW
jgi:hypothetical protein